MDWLDKRHNKENILTEEFMRNLHTKMFNKIWGWAGQYRTTNKNIGVDKLYIGVDLRQLLDDVKYWIANETFEPDEIAARFHHKLVYIHAFANGNGRHARLMADTILTDLFKLPVFTWGSGNLLNENDVRTRYIKALRQADNHDYTALLSFVRS